MHRICFFLIALMAAWSSALFAAPQTVSGASATLNADGVGDGVIFLGQPVTETTLTVGDGQNINQNAIFTSAASTDGTNRGNILFAGTAGTSIVNGTVGAVGLVMDNISGGLGSSSIIFNNGTVWATTFNITGNGTMRFNSDANGALQYNTDGTLIIGAGATFTGALTNLAANTGTLTLGSASTLIGAAGAVVSPLKQINVLAGNATIVGATRATTYFLAANTLSITGALSMPVGSVINTTLISDTVFGNIFVTGANTILAPVVTVNVDASTALLTGVPLVIVDALGVTSGVPILVTSNSARYTFVGININGDIIITPTLIPIPDVVPVPDAAAVGSVLDALIPIAAANPGSDLAFVLGQLFGLPTDAALTDALLQIAPISGLIGVNRESFNTSRQFQRVWLEHLQRNREQYCLYQNMKACCDPCYAACGCEGPRLWGTGFGYYGHQDDKDMLNGYKSNTWGGTVAIETPLICCLRGGIGFGYASTNVDENRFGNTNNIDNFQGTAYLSFANNCWYADGGFSYGWNRYHGRRHIAFAAIDRIADAKYNGQTYNGFLTSGYHYFLCDRLEVTPLGSLLYTHLDIDPYTETGADSLNLNINKQHYDYVQSGLGLKLATLLRTCCGVYIPELHSIWYHDFQDNALDVNATFTGIGEAGGIFTNRGPRTDRDTWNIGASVTCMANACLSVLLSYDYESSQTYYAHQGLVELSYDF